MPIYYGNSLPERDMTAPMPLTDEEQAEYDRDMAEAVRRLETEGPLGEDDADDLWWEDRSPEDRLQMLVERAEAMRDD